MPSFAPFSRGLRKRCPRCGYDGIFQSFFELTQRCNNCGLAFEREEGYWLGAMIVVMAITEGLYGIVIIGSIVATWPDVPWTFLWISGIVLNAIIPVVAYPRSKTIWMGLDRAFNPRD